MRPGPADVSIPSRLQPADGELEAAHGGLRGVLAAQADEPGLVLPELADDAQPARLCEEVLGVEHRHLLEGRSDMGPTARRRASASQVQYSHSPRGVRGALE